jgi:hypothetical protein
MEEIKTTVLKWNGIYSKIENFNRKGNPLYTNVLEVIKNIKELANDITVCRDRFNVILNQYLSENRAEIWLRFYIENPKNPYFEQEWATYLAGRSVDPKYDISYENSQDMTNRMKSLRSISYCDDSEILAVHEGRECEGNGWFCWYCDDMESRWHNKLLNELKSSNNVFLNPVLQAEFVEYAKGILGIPESWSPPIEYTFYSGPVYKDGWTRIQCMKEIVESIYYWGSMYKIKTTSDYSIFISVLSYINTVPPILEIIVNKCDSLLSVSSRFCFF